MGHVARMIEMRNSYKILVEKLGARRPLELPEHDIKIIRKVIGCGLTSTGSIYSLLARCLEHGNKDSVSIRGDEYLE
jgi:hypothetical protein